MIYVHVPFCRSFCIYCDFYSEIPCKGDEFERFAAALGREIGLRLSGDGCGTASADECRKTVNQIRTLYIGGGTPSVLPLSVLSSVLDSLRVNGVDTDFSEFTVEVNPDDIVRRGQEYVTGLVSLGVNRVSMGVQSFDDTLLKWMNRRHDASAAVRAYEMLRSAGIRNISVDLIFGISRMSHDMWRKTIERTLTLPGGQPEHISAYQLSVEPGSVLAGMAADGRYEEAPEEQCLQQYECLCSMLKDAGYEHYEISNFALPGYKAVHNSAYWSGCSYTGFGPGAHSYDAERGIRSWNGASIEEYEASGNFRETEILTKEQVGMERIMLSLRTASGITEAELRRISRPGAVDRMYAAGNLVRLPNGNLRIPENRFFISDAVISELI